MNVLIVDDDRVIQKLLADTLSREGFSVSVERDGEWALKTFENRSFDLVLLDLLLPAMSGYEVLENLRRLRGGKKVPVILISGVYKSALHKREAVEKHGAFAFLEKPFKTSQLIGLIKDALGRRYPQSTSTELAAPAVSPESTLRDNLADSSAEQEVATVEQTLRGSGGLPALRGVLSERPFPEVLAEVYRWKGTGALLLRRDRLKKIVYFRDGIPQSVKSNLLSECLGRVMVRERMISEAQCESSLEKMKESGRQQGTVLIDMGCISPHNLVYALKLQLQAKLFDVFAWTDGDYQFNPAVIPPPETVNLEMTAAAVIYEGVRRHFDDARLRQLLGPDIESLYVFPAEHPLYALQDAGLGEEEQQLLNAADGHKTVATLRALDLLGPHETLRFIYAMKCARMIDLKTASAVGKPRSSILKLASEAPRPPPLPPPPAPALADQKRPPALPTAVMRGGRNSPPPLTPPVKQKPGKSPNENPGRKSSGSLLPELSGVHPSPLVEEQTVRERLVHQVTEMRRMDYFQLLGVPLNAGREEIKRAYFALAKEYHPDKHFGSASAEIRQLAAQVYELISHAHDVLTDPEERARYEQDRARGVKADVGDAVGQILAAEGKFQKGEELLRQKNFRGAYQIFREAIDLYDQEGEFHAYLGWSLFQSDPQNPAVADSALRSLERAIALNPKSDRSYLLTGYVYKATGRPDKAEKHFEKAIQCNPDCTEALRELRLLGHGRR